MDSPLRFKHLLDKEAIIGIAIGFIIVFSLFALLKKPQPPNQSITGLKGTAINSESDQIYFEPEFYNYGDVLQAQRFDFTFKLVNKSSNEVFIAAFNKSCPCTLTSNNVVGLTVPAGSSLDIPIDYYTGSMSGRAEVTIEAGLKWKGLYLVRRALLRMNIIEDYYFEPKVLDFGTLYPGQIVTKQIIFIPKALTNFYLMPTQVWYGPFEVVVKENNQKTDAEHKATIIFHSPNISKREIYDDNLRISTASARVPVAKIPVRAQVVPELELIPDTIVLTSGIINEESLITVRTRKPSRILRVMGNSVNGAVPQEIPTRTDTTNQWDITHSVTIHNSQISGLDRMNFEVEVRTRPDVTEVWSGAVYVKNLNIKGDNL